LTKAKAPDVGKQIRKLRISRGLSLRALADRGGMSANAISLIERGENSPTVSTLHQITTALNVSIADLFNEETSLNAVFVKKDRGVRYVNDGIELENLGSGLPDQQIEPFRLIVEPGSGTYSDPISHTGQEFVYCLEGEIEYFVDGQMYKLESGDSLLLEAKCPHSWCNTSQAPASLLLIFQAAKDHPLAHQSHLEIGQ
jgi:transcriptional regulator with XRE-family HTH domain